MEYKLKQKIKKIQSEFEMKRLQQEQHNKTVTKKSAELERRVDE